MGSGNSKKNPFKTLVGQLASILYMVMSEKRKLEEVTRFLQIVIADEDFIKRLDAPLQIVEKAVASLLKLVGTVNVPAMTESFQVDERFMKDTSATARVKISCVGDNFLSWFGQMRIEPQSGSTLSDSTLTRDAYDREIIAALGGEANCETTLAEIWQLMILQKNGGDGVLSADGHANIFYVRDRSSALRAVHVRWYGSGWFVGANELDFSRWLSGRRVFVRNSCFFPV